MGLLKVASKFVLCSVIVKKLRSGKREFIAGQGDQPVSFGQPTKPEPLFGEDLLKTVKNWVMVKRAQHSTEDNIIRGRLIKSSIAT